MFKIISKSEIKTINLGIKLAELLMAGDIICLFGDLGTGKTKLASGIAKGIGVVDNITSPTFTILNEYKSNIPLYHFDVYRIDSEEFLAIGGEEYLYGNGIVLIEWSENISDVLPDEHLDIHINYCNSPTQNFNKRELIFKPHGKRYKDIMQKFLGVIN